MFLVGVASKNEGMHDGAWKGAIGKQVKKTADFDLPDAVLLKDAAFW